MRSRLDAYRRQLVALLPPGSLWQVPEGSRLRHLVEALAVGFAAVHDRALTLLDEADPRTTVDLLPDWERVVGLPGPCDDLGETLQQRRAAVVQKLTATGGATKAYFIELAAQLGYEITITEFNPFRAGESRAGDAVAGDSVQFAWQVNALVDVEITSFRAGQSAVGEPLRSWGNAQLECVFELLKPAHTTVIFAFAD